MTRKPFAPYFTTVIVNMVRVGWHHCYIIRCLDTAECLESPSLCNGCGRHTSEYQIRSFCVYASNLTLKFKLSSRLLRRALTMLERYLQILPYFHQLLKLFGIDWNIIGLTDMYELEKSVGLYVTGLPVCSQTWQLLKYIMSLYEAIKLREEMLQLELLCGVLNISTEQPGRTDGSWTRNSRSQLHWGLF
jgi:hypothetical protein